MRRVLVAVVCGLHAAAGVLHADKHLAARIETRIAFVIASGQVVSEYAIGGDSHRHLLPKFIAYARRRHVPVYSLSLMKDTQGMLLGLTTCPWTMRGRQCIVLVDDRQDANSQVATTVHELAHLEQGRVESAIDAEIFAETTAYVALSELGLDTSSQSMSYLLFNATQQQRHAVLTKREGDILNAVERLVQAGKA